MNSSAGSSLPPTVCQFCDKKGLPILPLRYAVARQDKGNAPVLKAPFSAIDKKKEQGKELSKFDLPADLAHYTTRLLRPGYLYVYDEARKEWSAYVVTKGAYLFQFDPYAKVPPGGWGKVEFSCKREGDAFIARCVTVKNATKATKVWLGFSDVAWTKDVLDKHSSPAYREAHMRSIDIAAWRGGGSQSHVAPFSELASRVAEYAATPDMLNKETAAYVTALLPVPYKAPAQMLATDATTKRALAMSSSLIKDLLPAAVSAKSAEKGKVVSAAWAFSPQDFYADAIDAQAMVAWGTRTAKPYRPALVALDDPAGMALELNGLALQRSAEFSENPQRKWKHDTALLIGALKEAVGHGAVEDDIRSNQSAADIAEGMANIEGGDQTTDALTLMTQGYGAYKRRLAERERARTEERERIRDASEAKSGMLGDEAWKKYTSYYDKSRVEQELADYQTKLTDFSNQTLAKLDVPYLAWLRSGTFSSYLSHNFDSKDLDSGASYTELVTQVIHNASGRTSALGLGFFPHRTRHRHEVPSRHPRRGDGGRHRQGYVRTGSLRGKRPPGAGNVGIHPSLHGRGAGSRGGSAAGQVCGTIRRTDAEELPDLRRRLHECDDTDEAYPAVPVHRFVHAGAMARLQNLQGAAIPAGDRSRMPSGAERSERLADSGVDR
nr:T6SS effector BTH_I2691 family protein [Burkholderia pseudomallei]